MWSRTASRIKLSARLPDHCQAVEFSVNFRGDFLRDVIGISETRRTLQQVACLSGLADFGQRSLAPEQDLAAVMARPSVLSSAISAR